jgi:sugar lactone lactonase YvrE
LQIYSFIYLFWRGACRVLVWKLREKDHLEDLGVDGRIILKWIFKQWDGGMDWIDLDQDGKRWHALVNAVMNLRVP